MTDVAPVAFAQSRLVGAQDHGDMAELGHCITECLIKKDLPGGVVDMVIPADDLGNAHLGIISHNGKIVSGVAVRPLNSPGHPSSSFLKGNGPFDEVISQWWLPSGARKANNSICCFIQVLFAAGAIIFRLSPFRQGLFSFVFQVFRCAGAVIGFAFIN